LHKVSPIYPRGPHPHPDTVGGRWRHGFNLLQGDAFETAELPDHDRAHDFTIPLDGS
jgi:hypothetical protein